jgi:hypothetical protein
MEAEAMSAEITVSDKDLRGATIAVLRDAHEFVIDAVLENVSLEGFDPNSHVLAVRLRAAVDALGGNPREMLDERRGTSDGWPESDDEEDDDFES